jgi:hypothetical protein
MKVLNTNPMGTNSFLHHKLQSNRFGRVELHVHFKNMERLKEANSFYVPTRRLQEGAPSRNSLSIKLSCFFFWVFSPRSHEFLFWQNSYFVFLTMRLEQGTMKYLFNVFFCCDLCFSQGGFVHVRLIAIF